MSHDFLRSLFLGVGATAGYLVTLVTVPVAASLRDGFRCLRRYQQIWLIPALFAVAHAAFRLWIHFFHSLGLNGSPSPLEPWTGWHPPAWSGIPLDCFLPALENTSAIFNCVVTTFPLSALVALFFICNWRGYQAVVFRGLCRRCGEIGGTVIHVCLTTCCLAALCKPVIFGGLPNSRLQFSETTFLRVGELTNTVSFFFEYLLGVAVQIYLVLLAYAWFRGLTFDFDALRRLALRRFVIVVKWALVILAISSVGINLPLILAGYQSSVQAWEPTRLIQPVQWGLSVVLLVFCATQAMLVLHNEPIMRAIINSLRFWNRHGWQVGWLVVFAALHFLVLAVADAFLRQALGEWTWPASAWSLLGYPLIWSGLTGWFLASWVCLFRRCEHPGVVRGELIRL